MNALRIISFPIPLESIQVSQGVTPVELSELQSQLELENARQIGLGGGFSEIGVGDVRIDSAQTNVVKDVERVRPEHESQILTRI
jgi:hypothetical protein